MKKLFLILVLLGLSHFAIGQSRFVLWKQVGGRVYNFSDSCKINYMRQVGSFYNIQANGNSFWCKSDSNFSTSSGGGTLLVTDPDGNLMPALNGGDDPYLEYDANLDIEPK